MFDGTAELALYHVQERALYLISTSHRAPSLGERDFARGTSGAAASAAAQCRRQVHSKCAEVQHKLR